MRSTTELAQRKTRDRSTTLAWAEHDLEAFASVFKGVKSLNVVLAVDILFMDQCTVQYIHQDQVGTWVGTLEGRSMRYSPAFGSGWRLQLFLFVVR
jgi:hypothetical protein